MNNIQIVIKELERAQKYCEHQNGLDYCKNCGLDFESLIKLLTAEPRKKCNHKWEVEDQCIDDSGKEYAVWNECKLCGKTKPYEDE